MAEGGGLELSWRVLFYLIDHDFKPTTNKDMGRALHISRSSVSRAVDALVAGKVLERKEGGDLEMGFVLAQAYARRLRYWAERHERLRMVQEAMGAELALLSGITEVNRQDAKDAKKGG